MGSGSIVRLSLENVDIVAREVQDFLLRDGRVTPTERDVFLAAMFPEGDERLRLSGRSFHRDEILAGLCALESGVFTREDGARDLTPARFDRLAQGHPSTICPELTRAYLLGRRLRLWRDHNGGLARHQPVRLGWPAHARIVAFIRNGDDREMRHQRSAVAMAELMGFLGVDPADIFLAGSLSAVEVPTWLTHQFPATREGMVAAEAAVGQALTRPGTLLFDYVTGHGDITAQGAYLVLEDGQHLPLATLIERVGHMAPDAYVTLHDQCFSAEAPDLAVHHLGKQMPVIGQAPNAESRPTSCQAFTPYWIRAIESGYDPDGDKTTSFLEALEYAVHHYNAKLQRDPDAERIHAAYRQSIPELTAKNLTTVLALPGPKVIELSTLWCPACRRAEKVIDLLRPQLPSTVTMYRISEADSDTGRGLVRQLHGHDARVPFPRMAFPTFLFFQGAQLQGVRTGGGTVESFRGDFATYLSLKGDTKRTDAQLMAHLEMLEGVPRTFSADLFAKGLRDLKTITMLHRALTTSDPQIYAKAVTVLLSEVRQKMVDGRVQTTAWGVADREWGDPGGRRAAWEMRGFVWGSGADRSVPSTAILAGLQQTEPVVVEGLLRGLGRTHALARSRELYHAVWELTHQGNSPAVRGLALALVGQHVDRGPKELYQRATDIYREETLPAARLAAVRVVGRVFTLWVVRKYLDLTRLDPLMANVSTESLEVQREALDLFTKNRDWLFVDPGYRQTVNRQLFALFTSTQDDTILQQTTHLLMKLRLTTDDAILSRDIRTWMAASDWTPEERVRGLLIFDVTIPEERAHVVSYLLAHSTSMPSGDRLQETLLRRLESASAGSVWNVVRAYLRHPDRDLRLRALALTESETNPKVLRDLAPLLNDEDPAIRAIVVRRIGDIRGQLASRLLKKALRDPDPIVVWSAADEMRSRVPDWFAFMRSGAYPWHDPNVTRWTCDVMLTNIYPEMRLEQRQPVVDLLTWILEHHDDPPVVREVIQNFRSAQWEKQTDLDMNALYRAMIRVAPTDDASLHRVVLDMAWAQLSRAGTGEEQRRFLEKVVQHRSPDLIQWAIGNAVYPQVIPGLGPVLRARWSEIRHLDERAATSTLAYLSQHARHHPDHEALFDEVLDGSVDNPWMIESALSGLRQFRSRDALYPQVFALVAAGQGNSLIGALNRLGWDDVSLMPFIVQLADDPAADGHLAGTVALYLDRIGARDALAVACDKMIRHPAENVRDGLLFAVEMFDTVRAFQDQNFVRPILEAMQNDPSPRLAQRATRLLKKL